MNRSAPLTRRTPLRPGRRSEPAQPPWWHGEIIGQPCAACTERRAVHGHHLIRRQVLKREARRLGFSFKQVLYDRRNRLALCALCHGRHHSGHRRLPLTLVPKDAWGFAEQLGLAWVIDHDYLTGRA